MLPIAALVLVLLTALLPSPYVIESPGPVTNTLGTTRIDGKATPVIEVPGRRTYPTTGALDLLTVSVTRLAGADPVLADPRGRLVRPGAVRHAARGALPGRADPAAVG